MKAFSTLTISIVSRPSVVCFFFPRGEIASRGKRKKAKNEQILNRWYATYRTAAEYVGIAEVATALEVGPRSSRKRASMLGGMITGAPDSSEQARLSVMSQSAPLGRYSFREVEESDEEEGPDF